MKLINTEFDSRLIDDRLRDAKGHIRPAKTWYSDCPTAVDFEEAEDKLESLLGDAYYNERHYHPAKQGRRKRYHGKSMSVDWWDERPGGSGNYEWSNFHNRLYGLIDKYIGKKFDDCFAALKERYMTNKDWRRQVCGVGNRQAKRNNLWMGIRDQFLSVFENDMRPGDYYVDDQGLIQKLPAKHKHPNRDIHRYEGEMYYEPNYGAIKCYESKLRDAKINILDYDLPDKLSYEFVRRFESGFPHTYSYWEIRNICNACFKLVDNRTVVTIKWHSPEWYAIKGRSGKRRPKKPDNSEYYDRSLAVQRYMAKHKEPGVTFHRLMSESLADIRRDTYIDAANRLMANAYKLSMYGKATYVGAIKTVMKSPWLDKACREPIFDADFQLDCAVYNYLNPEDKI